jgi:hypothetical protein
MLGDDDAAYLSVASTRTGGQHVADGYGAVVLPEGRRDVVAMMVAVDARATTAGTRELSLLNQRTGLWELLGTEKQPTVDAATALVVEGDASRFVSEAGEIRLRLRVAAPAAFALRIDRMALTAASR